MTDAVLLIDSGVVAIRQGYGLDRTYLLPDLPDGTSPKIRVEIEHNAYDFQSRYWVSLWTEDKRWVQVASIPNESPLVTGMPSYVCLQSGREQCVKATEEVSAQLVMMAYTVLS